MGGSVPDLNAIGRKAEPGLADMFRGELASLLERPNRNFPGAQPVSFKRGHIAELKKRDYYVCEKSDGIRCLLYFTFNQVQDERQEIHYLIDRKNDYYYVPGMHFPMPSQDPGKAEPDNWESYHVATLLDGELLFDTYPDGTRVLKYLVFDCLKLDGQSLVERTLDKRLAYFMEKIHKPYEALCRKFPDDVKEFAFRLQKKEFQFAYGTEHMFKQTIPHLKHGSDGLIFTCKDTPYKFGTDEHILKWKPAEENSIDFKIVLEFPESELFQQQERAFANGHVNGGSASENMQIDGDADSDADSLYQYDYDAQPEITLYTTWGRDDYRPFDKLYLTPDDWDKMKQTAIDTGNGLDFRIVECNRDTEGRWRFMRFRDDKADANYITVVQKTLESIEDSVTKEELIQAAPEIRQRWKERAGQPVSNSHAPQSHQGQSQERKRRADSEGRRSSEGKRIKPEADGD